jgi:hemoglobin
VGTTHPANYTARMTFEFLNPGGEPPPQAGGNADRDADSSPGSGTSLSLLDRLGGREGVERVVEAFYRRIEADEELRSLFPDDIAAGREKQKLFLEQWLGGEARYSDLYGHPRLRRRHFPFVISERAAGRWLRHMTEALRECDASAEVVSKMVKALAPLAHQMINEGEDVPREPLDDSVLS